MNARPSAWSSVPPSWKGGLMTTKSRAPAPCSGARISAQRIVARGSATLRRAISTARRSISTSVSAVTASDASTARDRMPEAAAEIGAPALQDRQICQEQRRAGIEPVPGEDAGLRAQGEVVHVARTALVDRLGEAGGILRALGRADPVMAARLIGGHAAESRPVPWPSGCRPGPSAPGRPCARPAQGHAGPGRARSAARSCRAAPARWRRRGCSRTNPPTGPRRGSGESTGRHRREPRRGPSAASRRRHVA